MISVSAPSLSSLERENLLDAFDSGWLSTGRYIDLAEQALRRQTGQCGAAVVSSGTTALHLALVAIGIGPGDEVIVPSSTYIATVNAVLYVGATPVVVDVDDLTWCIDVDAVRQAITAATRAVIAVDLYGVPADYAGLREALAGSGIALVADAAESLGATVGGAPVGTFADITTLSFFGNKVVTCGEGGAVVTASDVLLDRVRQLRNQGNHPSLRYHHDVLGFNYRMTNLSAAVLTGQLARIDELLASRRRVCGWYDELLDAVPAIRRQVPSPGTVASPWLYTLRLTGSTADRRDRIMATMADNGVETRPVFAPVQSMPYLTTVAPGSAPVARCLADEGLSLPTHPGLTRRDVEVVVRALTAADRSTV